ncbi:hypothetical protein FN846DRAFT_966897 [Sphaerosporella brunnea]|uniref:C3H1-type domain-containing protein n=1 Tax=Sphaerosporella brunnea TaxID=1250544 RepID=A0A5J5ELS6_9PEZI|nr:hypothetical protein FN846DRAFT_966897 [Sphaerosporella brunnea]
MPRNRNYLNHEDYPPEEDTHGWDYEQPYATYDIPLWMERMGMIQVPEWMRAADGSCTVDYRIGMGTDRPQVYTTSLGKKSADEEDVLPKQPACRFFAKHGHCKYGEECYFAHEKPGEQPEGVPRSRWIKDKEIKMSYEEVARAAREKREDEMGVRTKVCQYWGTFDGCKQGLMCLNRHIDD